MIIVLPYEYLSVLQGKRTQRKFQTEDGTWVTLDATTFGTPAAEDENLVDRRAAYAHAFMEEELTWIKNEIGRQSPQVRKSVVFMTQFPYTDSTGELYNGTLVDVPAWRYPAV